MRTILAVLWGETDADRVLETALSVGQGFGAAVTALYVRPAAETFVPSGDFGLALSQDYFARLQQDGIDKGARMKRCCEAVLGRHGLTLDVPAASGLTVQWVEAEGSAALQVGHFGRVFDLIVIARPDPQGAAETDILLEAALFETGRPVLTVPPQPPRPLGKTILLAWNGSTETARTLAVGMPLLSRAEIIHVRSIENAQVPGPSVHEVAAYLQRHGIHTTAAHDPTSHPNTGEVFLRQAAELGCDLLVKGAYTQSRLRQMIFGGTTRHIITYANLPVLMTH